MQPLYVLHFQRHDINDANQIVSGMCYKTLVLMNACFYRPLHNEGAYLTIEEEYKRKDVPGCNNTTELQLLLRNS